jgi:hypothetical protein
MKREAVADAGSMLPDQGRATRLGWPVAHNAIVQSRPDRSPSGLTTMFFD